MNKRATQQDLKSILIFLVIAVILLSFIGIRFIPWATLFGESNACKMSILAASRSQIDVKVAKVGPKISLDCPPKERIITYHEVKGKDDKIDPLKAKAALAREMYSCWDMIGQGKLDPFGDWEGDPTYCLVCKNIKFDDDFRKMASADPNNPQPDDPIKDTSPLKGFSTYLGKEIVPGQNSTFYKYFYGQDAQEMDEQTQSQIANLDYIDYNKDYSLFWRMEVDGHSPWKAIVIGAGAAAIVGVGIFLALPSGGTSLVAAAAIGGTLITGISVGGTLATAAISWGVIAGVAGAYTYTTNDGRTATTGIYLLPTEVIDAKITEGENKGERFCKVLVN